MREELQGHRATDSSCTSDQLAVDPEAHDILRNTLGEGL